MTKGKRRTSKRGHPEGWERLARRAQQDETWTLPLPVSPRRHPDLGLPRHGSISVGNIATGWLVDGLVVPFDGASHRVMDEHRKRGTNFGTDELVDALLSGAGAVAKQFPGSKLSIGNLSKGGGGDIPWSISHNAGRDADIGFYMLDEQGVPAYLPSIVPLTPPDGTVEIEGRLYRFDPARNWAFAKAMLSNPEHRVQYLFCARFLIRRMFEYAEAHGEDRKWLASLDPILRQPRGTAPHDDHFHVRVYCSEEDSAEGCRDIVQGEEIVPRQNAGYRAQVARAQGVIEAGLRRAKARDAADMDGEGVAATPGGEGTARGGIGPGSGSSDGPSAAEIADAVDALSLLSAKVGKEKLWALLATCEEPACGRILANAERRGLAPPVGLLGGMLERTLDPETALGAFRLLRRGEAKASAALAKGLLTSEGTLSKEHDVFPIAARIKVEAAHLLGWVGTRRDVPALLPLVASDDAEARAAAVWAVHAIVGAEVFPGGEAAASEPAKVPDPAAVWDAWRKQNGSGERVFREELRRHGYRVKKLTEESVPELLRAIEDPRDHISLHAQRTLRKILGVDGAVNIKDKAQAHWDWSQAFYRKNGK